MREYKVGEEITLVVQETNISRPFCCEQCFFDSGMTVCLMKCCAAIRSDSKNVISLRKESKYEIETKKHKV